MNNTIPLEDMTAARNIQAITRDLLNVAVRKVYFYARLI
jgi:hypothetical protein